MTSPGGFRTYFWALTTLALGVLIGVAGFTFSYAKGSSYLVDDPNACVNCHVMREEFNSWQVSVHRSVTCNDCHVPHDLVGKYVTKAEHGVRHSWVFTLGDPQVIRIKPSSLEIVQENCIRCHETKVSPMLQFQSGHESNDRCTHCHRGVAHGF